MESYLNGRFLMKIKRDHRTSHLSNMVHAATGRGERRKSLGEICATCELVSVRQVHDAGILKNEMEQSPIDRAHHATSYSTVNGGDRPYKQDNRNASVDVK